MWSQKVLELTVCLLDFTVAGSASVLGIDCSQLLEAQQSWVGQRVGIKPLSSLSCLDL